MCLGEKGCQLLHWDWDKRQGTRDRNGNSAFAENGEPAYEALPGKRRSCTGIRCSTPSSVTGSRQGRQTAELEPDRRSGAGAVCDGRAKISEDCQHCK